MLCSPCFCVPPRARCLCLSSDSFGTRERKQMSRYPVTGDLTPANTRPEPVCATPNTAAHCRPLNQPISALNGAKGPYLFTSTSSSSSSSSSSTPVSPASSSSSVSLVFGEQGSWCVAATSCYGVREPEYFN